MTYSTSPSSTDVPLAHADLTVPAKEQAQTSIQLAFEVFSSQEEKRDINKSHTEIGYRRSNRLISLSAMSLDQRRLFDVLFYLASQDIESDSLIYKDYVKKSSNGLYTVELGFLKWLLHLKNPRNDNLRKLLSNVQDVKFEFQKLNLDDIDSTDAIEWVSYTVFPTVSLSDANQEVMFQINSIFEEVLQNTHRYNNHHFLSLCHVMPDLPSKLVYDWILGLNQTKESFFITVSFKELKKILGFDQQKTYSMYGEFNRRVLIPAVEGINKNSNLSLEITPQREGGTSRITHIRFDVQRTDSQLSEKKQLMQFMRQYQDLQVTYGLQVKHFEEIQSNQHTWTPSYIDEAKKYVLVQLQRGIKIKNVSAYLMDTLRNGYKVGELDAAIAEGKDEKVQTIVQKNLNPEPSDRPLEQKEVMPSPTPSETPRTLSDNALLLKEQSAQGWKLFETLPPFSQMALIELFEKNAYTKFILQAEKLTFTSPDEFFNIILTNNRVKEVFGSFVYEKKETL